MKQAIGVLLSYFPNIKFTNTIKTQPYGTIYKNSFLNTLAYFETDMSIDEIQLRLKTIEKSMGRQLVDEKEWEIIIDIDLIKWNNKVIKPDDFKRGYMHDLMLQIQNIVNK